MKSIGVDVGSLNTKAVILNDSNILTFTIYPTGDEADASARETVTKALEQANLKPEDDLFIVSTGIGGKSVTMSKQQKSTTTCLARGINFLFPTVRLAIDMGAESTTVVKVNERGRLSDWANHDKCASGTGIFLQQMAKLMGMPMEDMSELSFKAKNRADISNTCAVFAESEVISHVHRVPPTPKEEIVAGIYSSMVSRTLALCKRIGMEKEVAVTGGVALNKGLVHILEEDLGFSVKVPDNPQLVAAIGAAVIARENLEKGVN